MTRRVVLVGGSGFLGRGLASCLGHLGHDVLTIGRGAPESRPSLVHWDGLTLGTWVNALEGADVVVGMAGKRVDCRPTKRNVAELIRSREDTVRLIGAAIETLDNPPHTWVQLSSLARFGDSGDLIVDEQTPPPDQGLPQQVEVCRRWETAYHDSSQSLSRRLLLRPGITLGGQGDPATKQLARLARLGLGGSVGRGQQWVSWIAAEDMFRLLVRAVTDDDMTGVYHLAAPEPARNAELMRAYRRAVGRRLGLPAPRPVVSAGAWLLGSDPQLALSGRRAIPRRLLEDGYEFRVPDLNEAVRAAVQMA